MNFLLVRRLFAGEQIARFGTVGPGGRPQLTPVPFAVIEDGDEGVIVCQPCIWPSNISGISRLRDIAESPRVSFLVDRSTAISTSWWAQADAVAEVISASSGDPRFMLARDILLTKYDAWPTLATRRNLVWTTVTRWAGWHATNELAA